MNFADIQSLTKFYLNFNDGQADQDISSDRIKQLINLRYTDEVNRAKQEGPKRWFRAYYDSTWAASAITITLPSSVARSELISIRDITNSDPGARLIFSEEGLSGDVFWKDHKTLQWGTTGPASAKTIRFVYFAQALAMVDDDDEPELIPDEFRNLLAWSAAVEARTIMDEQPPSSWVRRLEEARLDYWKCISRGRPTDDVPWVDQSENDLETGDLV